MKAKEENNLKAVKGNGNGYNEHAAVAEITKLPLAMCRQILNSGELQYSDEEVLKIRDYLYRLAAISSEQAEVKENREEARLISLTEDKHITYAQSNYLRTG